MLRTKFKNLSRPARADKAGISVPPPLKKAKRIPVSTMATFTDSDTAEYKLHVEYLKQTYNSKKWSLSGMQTLLEQTSNQRRSWIKNDGPSVKEVLDMFPCFADPRIVRWVLYILNITQYSFYLQMLHEFCLLTGFDENTIKERWARCRDRIMKYAPLEQKKIVKSLLRDMDAADMECEGTLYV